MVPGSSVPTPRWIVIWEETEEGWKIAVAWRVQKEIGMKKCRKERCKEELHERSVGT